MLSIIKKLVITLVFLLALTPSLANAEQGDTFSEGSQETLHIRQPIVEPQDSTQKTSAASSQASVGHVDVWISTNPKKINWEVVVYPPYKGNGFNGWLNITNLSSGLNSGRYNIKTMVGSMSPPIYNGRYGAMLTGVLTYNGVTTGVTMESKYLTWEN
jgi:hypothetical protein